MPSNLQAQSPHNLDPMNDEDTQGLVKYIKQCEVDKANLNTCNQHFEQVNQNQLHSFWNTTEGKVTMAVLFFGMGYATARLSGNEKIFEVSY